jgi:SOS response regulatory protein OraA/RecX
MHSLRPMGNMFKIDGTETNWRQHVENLAEAKRNMHITGLEKNEADATYRFLLDRGYEPLDVTYVAKEKRMEVWYRRCTTA